MGVKYALYAEAQTTLHIGVHQEEKELVVLPTHRPELPQVIVSSQVIQPGLKEKKRRDDVKLDGGFRVCEVIDFKGGRLQEFAFEWEKLGQIPG